MHRLSIPCRFLVVTALIFVVGASPAIGQEVFADWTSNTTFDLGTVTASVSTSNPINVNVFLFQSFGPVDGQANYPSNFFTPMPPVGTTWSLGGIDNASPTAVGSVDVTVAFSEAVTNPRFHFINLDNGIVDFGAASVTRLSGNLEFEVSGSMVNTVPAQALVGGCEDDTGGNPNGACGSVELAGSFTSVTFTITDTEVVVGAGDGFGFTVSADTTPRVPVVEVPTISEMGQLALALLLAIAALGMMVHKRSSL